MTYIKNHFKDIFIFLILIIIVTLLQINLLEPQLHYGFTPDDWWPLALYKHLNSDFLTKILEVWRENGLYTSYQVMYISILHYFFGFNFQAYQVTNIILKALSVLMIFPLILTVFKSRYLAILTTVLYAVAYSPLGTLEIVVRGSDFIGIIFISVFFIAYYKTVTGKLNNTLNLIALMFLLALSMFFSPIRIYPLLVFLLLIESYVSLMQRSKTATRNSCKRIIFIFFPYIAMFILSPVSILRFASVNAPAILGKIADGNWQLLLYPLGSLGSIFLLNDFWKYFGTVQMKTLNDYIFYLLTGPFIIFLLISLFYSFILSLSLKKAFRFVLRGLLISLFLLIIVFVLAKHRESIDQTLRMGFDYAELYGVFFAVFILALAFSVWREWVKNDIKSNLLLTLWLGPSFAFIYIVLTWIFKDYVVLFKTIHTYLNIPSIGISLFMAGTLGLLYHRVGDRLAALTFLLLIPIFFINKSTIANYFSLNNYSMNAQEHTAVRGRIMAKLVDFDNTKPSFFYFDTSGDYLNGRFYEVSILGRFSDWMFFKGEYPPGSCNVPVFVNDNLLSLKQKFTEKDGKVGFSYVDYCGRPTFYDLKQFYTFKLINKEPIDVKIEVLEKLEKDNI